MDYKNGKIYRIVCEETGRQYIGSTCSTLVKRLSSHKSIRKKSKRKCSCHDFINPKIILIEDYPCDRKEQLLMRERYHMENTDCVNLARPIISKEELSQYYKEYYERNRENKRKQQDRKITCECGCIVSRSVLSRHKKSAKHNKLMHN